MKRTKITLVIVLIAISVILVGLYFSINILDNNIQYNREAEEEKKKIVLEGSYDSEKKQVYLSWDTENSEDYIYRCYQGKEGTTGFQTISTTTFEEGEYIKVLNIYPGNGNNLATWMNSYGMGIIKVDQVTLSAFNGNPTGYTKDSEGNWKYDVLVLGFWDANNGQDLNYTSARAVEEFINAGKGCIFGHDTLYATYPNFSSLAKYVNISTGNSFSMNTTTSVYLNKTGVFTSYPWEIGKAGTYLTIPASHNLDQLAYGDIWIKFNAGISPSNNNFYLTTWNNCAMIQTGHSGGAATVDEQKILANLIFYTNQLTSVTEMYDYTAIDITSPTKVTGINQTILDTNTINIKYREAEDEASTYSYYIKGIPKLDNLQEIESNVIAIQAKSGIAGYSYLVDNNIKTTGLDNVVDTVNTSVDIDRNGIDWSKTVYFHIAAVDNAGNMSEVSTIELQSEDPAIFYYYPDDNNIVLRVATTKPIKQLKYPSPEMGEEIILQLNSKKNFAADYNVKQDKTILVELILEDGTVITKELNIPATK